MYNILTNRYEEDSLMGGQSIRMLLYILRSNINPKTIITVNCNSESNSEDENNSNEDYKILKDISTNNADNITYDKSTEQIHLIGINITDEEYEDFEEYKDEYIIDLNNLIAFNVDSDDDDNIILGLDYSDISSTYLHFY